MSTTAKNIPPRKQLRACLNLMRRLPPHKQKDNLESLMQLVSPELGEELAECVDIPLEEAIDPETNQHYLLCDYNRDGASHRSPWSNKYFPPPPLSSTLYFPPDSLRALEVEANALFQIYRELYYDGQGVSSVFFWDLPDEDDPNDRGGGNNSIRAGGGDGFAGCFAIKKKVMGTRAFREGTWDSMHVVEVQATARGAGATASYKLTSTVQISLFVDHPDIGEACLAGTVTRATEATHAVVGSAGGHVANMGRMIEDMEISVRGDLDVLYMQRTRDIVSSVRKPPPPLDCRRYGQTVFPSCVGASAEHTQSLFAAIAKHAALRGDKDGDVFEG